MSGEIITVAQMRAIDAASARAGVSTRTLMENAGRAVAQATAARFEPQPTLVLCGPGNNGGDGFVAARLLRERGWPVRVASLAPIAQLRGDAADAARAWGEAVETLQADIGRADLYIDALFGAGLSRPLDGVAADWASALADSVACIVAIDVPSGVDGDSGRPLGDVSFRAALTVTFQCKKPAHVLMPGRALCGDIVVHAIGVPDEAMSEIEVALWENDPSCWRMPWPAPDTHKHARGHVMVATGGRARTGAARLTARAALRAGAGLVTALSPPDALDENAMQLTAVMVREAGDEAAYAEAARTAQCLAIGPGFGTSDAHYKLLCAAIEATPRCPLVLDADAITLLAPLTHGFEAHDVMTPHVGEFRRAFPGIWSNAENRIDAARAAAAYARCVVLLKGADTVIAAPDGRAIVNTTGTPFLASAGAGDVLAGVIAGLIGQGMDSFEAAAAGAWLHGKAAEAVGPGLIAEDLTEILPVVLNGLAPAPLRKAP